MVSSSIRDVGIPAAYSTVAEEYEAATERVGLVDRSQMGRLRVIGNDAIDLLNRLSTNKLNDLEIGLGKYSVVPTNKGRIVDLLFVLRLEDHLFVLTSPEARQVVADWIEFYTFVEDVTVEDWSSESSMLGLTGPEASELLDEVAGPGTGDLLPYASTVANIDGVDGVVVRTDFLGAPGFDIVLPVDGSDRVWQHLLDQGSAARITPIGTETLEVLRIEQGLPAFGRELTEEFNPLEAGLIEHISFNKECYIGQEVIARLNTYDKVQKRLVGLSWEGDDLAPKAKLSAGGKRVGTVTSSASPRHEGRIGLAYVRNAHTEPGTALAMTSSEGETEVRVEELRLGR